MKEHTLRGKKPSLESPEQLQEKIRQRAYELYERRGKEDGHDFEDWLNAESEITGKVNRQQVA